MPRLFTPHPHLQNISSDLHELRKWSWAARGEQLLHLLHTSYATVSYQWISSSSPNWHCSPVKLSERRQVHAFNVCTGCYVLGKSSVPWGVCRWQQHLKHAFLFSCILQPWTKFCVHSNWFIASKERFVGICIFILCFGMALFIVINVKKTSVL